MVGDVSGWCGMCGRPLAGHGTVCAPIEQLVPIGWTDNTKARLTEADIRRIVREELERAKGKP